MEANRCYKKQKNNRIIKVPVPKEDTDGCHNDVSLNFMKKD
jgi:hypothetical protein